MIFGVIITLVGTALPENCGFPIAVVGCLMAGLGFAKDWLNKRPIDRQRPHF